MITRILIVDDDEEDRELFCQAVKEVDAAIECTEAVDGEDGLHLLKELQPPPDFIFLDINMPRVNGLQFLKRIKGGAEFAEIPVIIYSTTKLSQVKTDLLKNGAVYFITKPDKLSELKQQIVFVLERRWETVHP
jgi:CheY-like chemotaxis protein